LPCITDEAFDTLWLGLIYIFVIFRFVILKLVPRDLLSQLPVPKRIQVYLDTPFYYSEAVADWTKDSEQQEPQSNSELESPPSQTQAPPPLDDLSARPYEHEP